MSHRIHAAAALAALLSALPAGAAEEPEVRSRSNVLYLELGGNALVYSINYERFVSTDLALRVGAGFMSVNANDQTNAEARASLLLAPVMLGWTGARSGAHAFELGGGVLVAYAGASVQDGAGGTDFKSGGRVYPTATAGYRYAPLAGGLHFRAAFTPVLAEGNFLPWFGVSAGVVFCSGRPADRLTASRCARGWR